MVLSTARVRALGAATAAGVLLTIAGPAASPAGAQLDDARVVVAAVDSGVNPYHDAFQRATPSVTSAVLAEFGIDSDHIISLTRTGNPVADFAADTAKWAAVQDGEPYWFEGTNIIGVSMTQAGDGDPTTRPILPDDDGDTHGVGVSHAVLDANPEAIVLFVEDVSAASETFAFTHPAVDIVTTSYGFPGSIPLPFHLEDSFTGVVEMGKIHTGAADNSPAASPPDGTSGPWWTFAIAGFHEDSSGTREALSGNAVDFVSDFTQDLAYCDICQDGTESVSGTSFATPRTAGVTSKILLEARRFYGHTGGIEIDPDTGEAYMVRAGGVSITNWQLRRALEEASYYPGPGDFEPGGFFDDLTGVPVVPATPYIQTGWGLVSANDTDFSVVTEALAQLGVGGLPTRTKSIDACEYNMAQHIVRYEYWNATVGSESFGFPGPDPYLPCGAETTSADDPDPVVPEAPAVILLPLLGMLGIALAARSRTRETVAA